MVLTHPTQSLLPLARAKVDEAQASAAQWDARAVQWAQYQEKTAFPLFADLLTRIFTSLGHYYLDIGCGSGGAALFASALGAIVSGVDISSSLLAFARARVPAGDFRLGDMSNLPFADGLFDRITLFNTIQYAPNPYRAVKEAIRVATRDALIAITTWGRPEDCDLTTYLNERRSYLPPSSLARRHETFDLSADGALEAFVAGAGLRPVEIVEVDCPIVYPDLDSALRGLLSTGTAVSAIEYSGEETVRLFTEQALAPYRLSDGSYHLRNTFLYIIAAVN